MTFDSAVIGASWLEIWLAVCVAIKFAPMIERGDVVTVLEGML